MNTLLKGIRPLDYVLAAVLTAAGIFLMWENITAGDDADLAHPVSTHSWLIMPLFLLVTVPVLWRRRNILAVTGVTVAASLLHLVAFGWLTRCGVALPVSFALAYAVARFAGTVRNQLIGLGGIIVLQLVVLFHDSSIGPMLDGLVVALPGAAVFYGIGALVQNRASRKAPVAEHATV